MTAKNPETYDERVIERALTAISDTNRLDLVRYFEHRRLRNIKTTTLRNYAHWLRAWGHHLAGRSFRDATADDAQGFLAGLKAKGMSPSTLVQAGTYLIAYYNWANKGKPVQADLIEALRLRSAKAPERRPVTDEEMTALLHATTNLRDRTIVALLRDSGLRISELLALNVDSVRFDEERGCARLELPEKAPRLKTGPRTLFVQRCTSLLRALLFQHPQRTVAGSALFVSHSVRCRGGRLTPGHVSAMLRRLCQNAGIRHLSAHFFRHTRATEAARDGWNEAYLRQYFGWANGSKMPAHYTHLTPEDVRDFMQRRWTNTAPTQAPQPADALASALAELLRRGSERSRPPAKPARNPRDDWGDNEAAPVAVVP